MPGSTKSKTCFVVGPIGTSDSDDRIHADWLLEEIIAPVFDKDFPTFKIERADKLTRPGSINDQVITALLTADLVIADISTLNANAFYEIGIRHMVQKPIIHMHLVGQRIPFDIAPFRSIEFSRVRPKDLRDARRNLKDFVTTVLSGDYQVENPVTYARGKVEFDATATKPERILQEQLESIFDRLGELESSRSTDLQLAERLHRARMRLYDTKPVQITIDGKPTFRISLLAGGTTSTRQLHEFSDEVFSAHFEKYSKVTENEGEATIAVIDSPINRRALEQLEARVYSADLGIGMKVTER